MPVPGTALYDEIEGILKAGQERRNRQSETFPKDPLASLRLFEKARDILGQFEHPDPKLKLMVSFCLMTVETDITYDKRLNIKYRIEHHRRAEKYSVDAHAAALKSRQSSSVAQVKLEQAFLKGRKAELESKRYGVFQNIRKLKSEALEDMRVAAQELETADAVKYKKYEAPILSWQIRVCDLQTLVIDVY